MDSSDWLWTACFVFAGLAVFLTVIRLVDKLIGVH